jgi:molecular chaperone GrpE
VDTRTDMTDDTETQETAGKESIPADDQRFEVKWRKKNEPSPPPQPLPDADPQADTVETLSRRLAEEEQRVKDLQDRWHRAAADLANLRRRTEQEREEVEQFASMLLIQELLPVLDNFQRALATIPGNLAMLTWIQGVMLIERHLAAILERQGLTPIEAQGQPFNPHQHEAVSERETAEAPPGTVLQEYQRGFAMHGRVIRPALVEVAKAQTPAAQPEPQTPGPSEPVEATSEEKGEEIAEEAESENTGP